MADVLRPRPHGLGLGSQNVIAMDWYIAMAVVSSAPACSLCHLEIQRAQAVVTVRLERAHAQLFGQGEGLLIVGNANVRICSGECLAFPRCAMARTQDATSQANNNAQTGAGARWLSGACRSSREATYQRIRQ
jgi:hypothetical protein